MVSGWTVRVFLPKCLCILQHYIFILYLVEIDASQCQWRQLHIRFITSFHTPGSSVLKLKGHKVRGTYTHLLSFTHTLTFIIHLNTCMYTCTYLHTIL